MKSALNDPVMVCAMALIKVRMNTLDPSLIGLIEAAVKLAEGLGRQYGAEEAFAIVEHGLEKKHEIHT